MADSTTSFCFSVPQSTGTSVPRGARCQNAGLTDSHVLLQQQVPVYNMGQQQQHIFNGGNGRGSSTGAPPTVTNAYSSDQVAFTPVFRTSCSMEDEYPNVASVESCYSTATQGSQARRTQRPTIKLEMKKDEFEVKEGHEYWDRVSEAVKEDFLNEVNKPAPVKGRGFRKGERIFKEVEEFFNQTNPKVKELRQKIPKAVLLIFHTNLAAEGREKIRDMWSGDRRPREWPGDVPFVDPNNGQKLKKDDGLKTMFDFLKQYFQENKENIIGILGLDMPSAPVKHPVIAKVEAQTQRSRKDLKELLKFSSSDLLVSKIRALESELEQTYRTPSVQFQMASSIGALAVKYQTEEMPEADVIKTCDEISATFGKSGLQLSVQPQSGDQGHMYSNGAGSGMPSTMGFQSNPLSPLTSPPPTSSALPTKFVISEMLTTPETIVIAENDLSDCDTMVGPSQNFNQFSTEEILQQLNQAQIVELVDPSHVAKGLKRVASVTSMVPEKKIKDEDIQMAKGFEPLVLNDDPPMPSLGMGEAVPVDVDQVMTNITNNPTMASYLENNIPLEDAKLLSTFLKPLNNDVFTISDKLSRERLPATNFEAGLQNVGIPVIPSTVEEMELDDPTYMPL